MAAFTQSLKTDFGLHEIAFAPIPYAHYAFFHRFNPKQQEDSTFEVKENQWNEDWSREPASHRPECKIYREKVTTALPSQPTRGSA